MSAVQKSITLASDNPKAEQIAEYLQSELAGCEEVYFKGKFIADEVDLSPKEIGALIPTLQDTLENISIEAWSYTGATTWRATKC